MKKMLLILMMLLFGMALSAIMNVPSPAIALTPTPTFPVTPAGTDVPDDVIIRSYFQPSLVISAAEFEQVLTIFKQRLDALGLTAAQVTLVDDRSFAVEMPLSEQTSLVLDVLNQRGMIEWIYLPQDVSYDSRMEMMGQQVSVDNYEVILSGSVIDSATMREVREDLWEVEFTLRAPFDEQRMAFAEEHAEGFFGIVVDGVMVSFTSIVSRRIPGLSETDARRLIALMEFAPYPTPLDHYLNDYDYR